jgi:hypothetical protein
MVKQIAYTNFSTLEREEEQHQPCVMLELQLSTCERGANIKACAGEKEHHLLLYAAARTKNREQLPHRKSFAYERAAVFSSTHNR